MRKVKLYIVDSSAFSLDDLSSVPLNEEEMRRVEKAFSAELKKERILSKYLKDKYVGDYFLNEHNKPLSADKCFNLSHSDGLILLGICDVDVGVDVERITEVSPQMKSFISSGEELDYMSSDERFFEIWTNKEALMKCKGVGIVGQVSDIPGLPINGRRSLEGELYSSRTLKLKDYIISVCIKGDELPDIEQFRITSL